MESSNPHISHLSKQIDRAQGTAFASANIALIKYWGKRDNRLNLPTHSSLSLSLGSLGTYTCIRWNPQLLVDSITLNDRLLETASSMSRRLSLYLDRFRPSEGAYEIYTRNSVPTAAGLASSASGYCALVLALNKLHGWRLSIRELSLLARMGSGSASRSFFRGFALWHAGIREDGLDSYAEPVSHPLNTWHWLVACVHEGEKSTSSSEGMLRSKLTCPWFRSWVSSSQRLIGPAKSAVELADFTKLGQLMERSTLQMHATMVGSKPSILYWSAQSLEVMRRVVELRQAGLECYFTLDAGPNVKILHRACDLAELLAQLSPLGIKLLSIDPWDSTSHQ